MNATIEVTSAEAAQIGGKLLRCTIGKSGFIAASEKREGDLKTPIGRFRLRECWYRADKMEAPITRLPLRIIEPQDGWCDDPAHPDYNRYVILPFAASHENLWRADDCYDLIVPLGYNDDPPVASMGSAIFMHIAKPGFTGTEGCVAFAKEDLLAFLPELGPDSWIDIKT